MFLLYTFAVLFGTTKISSVCGRTWCPSGTYGDECDKNCSKQCRPFQATNTVHCHIESGLCSEGCTAGWYGGECNKACSTMCIQNVCNLQDGVCTQGCKDGRKGKFCEDGSKDGDAVSPQLPDGSKDGDAVSPQLPDGSKDGDAVSPQLPVEENERKSEDYLTTIFTVLAVLAVLWCVGSILLSYKCQSTNRRGPGNKREHADLL